MPSDYQKVIEEAWENRELLKEESTKEAIRNVIEEIDKGRLRTAEPTGNSQWQVNEWVKKAVILYFPIQQMETIEVGPFEFHDKMALKSNYKELGIRVVPHAVARYGAYISAGVCNDAIVHKYWCVCKMLELWWILGQQLALVHRLGKMYT